MNRQGDDERRPGAGQLIATAFAWGIGIGFLVTLVYIFLR